MFTPELCNVVWLSKFRLDLPPRYDDTVDPTEFLQLFELSIEGASGDEKITANWFPMALKDGARSWLLNLLEGSVSSWEEMCVRFIANFQATHDHPRAAGDLRRIKQQPGETLQKYIQRFNNLRLKIPKVKDEAIISAFTDGLRDIKMKEELAIHEDLCTALEMFNMANKCARAEEGRLSLLDLPDADSEDKKAKAKDMKRKGPAVFAAEQVMKCGCDHPESSKSNRPFCVFHNVHNHNTNDCQELRSLHEGTSVDVSSVASRLRPRRCPRRRTLGWT